MSHDIESRLNALKPHPHDELAGRILYEIDRPEPRPTRLPYLYGGIVGALLGAAAMYLLMCTFSQPRIIVREIVPEVVDELPTESRPLPQKPVAKPSLEERAEIALFGLRFTPLNRETLDLDAMLAERAAYARRARSAVASIYTKLEIGRRETNYEFSPKEYRELLEKEMLR